VSATLIGAGLLGCRFPEEKLIGERPRVTAVATPRSKPPSGGTMKVPGTAG
jgi:hypothetical protein